MVPMICPRTNEEALPPEDFQSESNDKEDPYGPPDEVASDPPTFEWFWSQYDLYPWKSLPSVEKARQVAFKKEKADEKVRKVNGTMRLIAVWRWDDKLQRATDEELLWAPNQMARSFMLVYQQEANQYVKRCKVEEGSTASPL
ncbi:Actin-related protein 2 [Hordeum vulgare]|nr:Actin-related protein 2 [Hordeum vulgare]